MWERSVAKNHKKRKEKKKKRIRIQKCPLNNKSINSEDKKRKKKFGGWNEISFGNMFGWK